MVVKPLHGGTAEPAGHECGVGLAGMRVWWGWEGVRARASVMTVRLGLLFFHSIPFLPFSLDTMASSFRLL